jgi:rubrerythrin
MNRLWSGWKSLTWKTDGFRADYFGRQSEVSMKSEQELEALTQFFRICAQNEQLCAELYHFYSDLFLDDLDVSRLWKKTAMEEENHQKQFELALRLVAECDFEPGYDVERALNVNRKFILLLQHVRNNPPDLKTALHKAIEMEDAIADLHMDSAVKFKDKDTQDLFKAMFNADHGHMESLKLYLTITELANTEMSQ